MIPLDLWGCKLLSFPLQSTQVLQFFTFLKNCRLTVPFFFIFPETGVYRKIALFCKNFHIFWLILPKSLFPVKDGTYHKPLIITR